MSLQILFRIKMVESSFIWETTVILSICIALLSSKPYVPIKFRAVEYGNVLDEGELSVAQFNPDGTLTWIPLVFGTLD